MALPPRELNFPPELNFLAPIALDDLVRVGRDSDGGYVIPKTLIDETDFLVSFGIAKDWSFESDFLSLNPRIRIHAYDHTISRAFFLKQILRSLDGRLFRKSGLSEFMHRVRLVRDYSSFFSGNAKHYQQRVHNRNDSAHDATIKDVIGRTDSNRIFVKMDIEGSEYRVIRDLLTYSSRIIGMAAEFHGTDPLRETFVSCIRSFQSAYEIAHLHGNNYSAVSADGVPECLEITFIRKDFVVMSARRSSLPVPGVDRPSTERKPDFRISFKA